jgi:group I intron endonuclease
MGFIYLIRNNLNNLIYIGSTRKDINKRLKEHFNCSRYRNSKLYKAMRQDGTNNFTIELIENCSDHNMAAIEGFYILLHNSIENGYNSNKIVKCSKFKDYYQLKNITINNCYCGGKYRYTGKHCHLITNKHLNYVVL